MNSFLEYLGRDFMMPPGCWESHVNAHANLSAKNQKLAFKAAADPFDEKVQEKRAQFNEERKQSITIVEGDYTIAYMEMRGPFTTNIDGLIMSMFDMDSITPNSVHAQLNAIQTYMNGENGESRRVDEINMITDTHGGRVDIVTSTRTMISRGAANMGIENIGFRGEGRVGSGGVDLSLLTRGKGEVVLTSLTEMVLHSVYAGKAGYWQEIQAYAKSVKGQQEMRAVEYAKRMQITAEEWIKLMDGGNGLVYYSAQEAVEAKLATRVEFVSDVPNSGSTQIKIPVTQPKIEDKPSDTEVKETKETKVVDTPEVETKDVKETRTESDLSSSADLSSFFARAAGV